MSVAPPTAPSPPRRPRRFGISRSHWSAARLALGYAIVGVVYILVSGQLAANRAHSKLELKKFEMMKGLAFVLVTAGLLHLLALRFMARLAARRAEIRRQREIMLATEKRAAAGLFAASVAHDINNMLMVSSVALEKLAAAPDLLPETTGLVSTAQQANTRLGDLARRLGVASGYDPSTAMQPIDLSTLALETVTLARLHLKVTSCTIDTRIAPGVRLTGDATLIHRMLLNLLLNAADASGNAGHILVSLEEQAGQVSLQVEDDGPGVPEPERENIFQPLYTTKQDGTGLGLLSVRLCARAHGGDVALLPSALGGACFRVTLSAGPR